MPTTERALARRTAERGRAAVVSQLLARAWSVHEAHIGRRPVLLLERGDVRRVVRVAARRVGSWQTSTKYAAAKAPAESRGRFWVFVALGGSRPAFYVVPEDWMVEDIWARHQEYLAKHGGKRARTPDSTHHSIKEDRITEWRDRWDLLDVEAS